jgi:hypothetical protein
MEAKGQPILIYRVEAEEFPLVEDALEHLRNKYLPDCSTSRIIKSDSRNRWFAFLNVYRLKNQGPEISPWTPCNLTGKKEEC